MKIKETKFYFFEEMCREKFGASGGEKVILQADLIYTEMMKEMDDRGSSAIHQHMQQNMLPTIAYYRALLDLGHSKEEAYTITLEMTQRSAKEAAMKNKHLGDLKLGYFLFKLFCKKVMKKNFPAEGWEIEWVTYNKDQIHMNMHRCIYYETTVKYGCPEMCTIFCKNDNIAFAGYKPAIVFERHGTIGEGKKVCDFHFYNKKRSN